MTLVSVTEKDALKNLKLLRKSFSEHISKYQFDMESFVQDHIVEGVFRKDDFKPSNFDCTPADIGDYLQKYPEKAKQNLCSTSCCIVGYAAISGEPEFLPKPYESCFAQYSHRLFCEEDCPNIWDFMFAGHHIKDTNYALIRLDMVISLLENNLHWEDTEIICSEWDKTLYTRGTYEEQEEFYENWEEKLNVALK